MEKIQIWHNNKCSKSREAVGVLKDLACEYETIKYLQSAPNKDEIKKIIKMLGLQSAREMMRTKEDIYKELELKNENNEERLIDAMVAHPRLIERPIVIKGDKAIIARPPSLLEGFLA